MQVGQGRDDQEDRKKHRNAAPLESRQEGANRLALKE
jgi:hypothetical protein